MYAFEEESLEAELGRRTRPEDVESLLCSNARISGISNPSLVANIKAIKDRRRSLFIGMVHAFLTDNEAEERIRQQEGGRHQAPMETGMVEICEVEPTSSSGN